MEDKFEIIEKKVDILLTKVSYIDNWIDQLNEDFLWDFTDFDQSAMPSWFHLYAATERMENILLALNQKFNLNADEIDIDLNKKVVELEIENQKLQKKNKEIISQFDSLKKTFNEQKHLINVENALLETQVLEWQKVVNEMAHSINTDLYVAVSYQSYHKDIPDIQKALAHTIQIRDLVNLTMWLLKKNDINIGDEMELVNLQNIVNNQLQTIYHGISTLRISSDDHEDKIKLLFPKIEVTVLGEPTVLINKELSSIYDLLLKDLLRNALKNTDEQNPQMAVSIFCEEEKVEIKIENNSVILSDFEEWFNNDNIVEPNISKSTKVGLRVIKKWVKELSLFASLKGDSKKGITSTTLIIPKEVKWKR